MAIERSRTEHRLLRKAPRLISLKSMDAEKVPFQLKNRFSGRKFDFFRAEKVSAEKVHTFCKNWAPNSWNFSCSPISLSLSLSSLCVFLAREWGWSQIIRHKKSCSLYLSLSKMLD